MTGANAETCPRGCGLPRWVRLTPLVAIPLLLNLNGGPAWAYWNAGSEPGGSGTAVALTVNQGATPTASPLGTTITISWPASTLSNGDAVSGYAVSRYDVNTLTPQPIQSTCTDRVASTTCTEDSVPAGEWVYTVTPVFATSWRGAESPKSNTVTVSPTTPVNPVTPDPVSSNSLTPNPLAPNPVAPEPVAPEPVPSELVSPEPVPSKPVPSDPATPDPATPDPVATEDAATQPSVNDPLGPTAGPVDLTAPAASDPAGTSASALFTLTADDTAPTVGTVTYLDGVSMTSSVSVSFTAGTDDGSGIGARLLQRSSASRTGDICGTFGPFTTVTNGTNPTASPLADTVSPGSCYKYQYVVSDKVGNQVTAAGQNIVRY